MKLSIIVPFRDEAENVGPVLAEIRRYHPDAEIIAVDDCSTDATLEILRRHRDVQVIELPGHLGQGAALYSGLKAARGDVCVTMDGDGQSSAADIKRLLSHIPEYDFVNGRRARRRDTPSRIVAARFANSVRNLVLRDGMQDTGGSPKAMKRECVDSLAPFDGMHRYIPALLVRAGFKSIEIEVEHRERLHGTTKYTNLRRGVRGIRDLIGVSWWLSRRIDAAVLAGRSDPAPAPTGDDAASQR